MPRSRASSSRQCFSDDGEEQSSNDPKKRGDNWIQGVRLCAWCTAGILLLNIILAVVAIVVSYPRFNGRSVASASLYRGKCSVSKNWATGLHLIFNVLSTAMLATSNYCMQCLSAPSRADVDRAHSQRIYNSAAYFALGPSEYGVVMAQTGSNFKDFPSNKHGYEACFEDNIGKSMSSFHASVADGDFEFLSKQECVDVFANDFVSGRGTLILQTNAQITVPQPMAYVHKGNNLETFGMKWESPFSWMCGDDCTKDAIYINNWTVEAGPWSVQNLKVTYPTLRGRGIMTTFNTDDWLYFDDVYFKDDLRHLADLLSEYPEKIDLRAMLDDSDNWSNSSWASEVEVEMENLSCPEYTPEVDKDYAIDSCLSQRIEENCQLVFSPLICLIVIFCNVAKVICMFLAARDDRNEIFLTAGDAISSFLTRPDPATMGVGLLSRADIRKKGSGWHRAAKVKGKKSFDGLIPSKNTPNSLPQRLRWVQAASLRRWFALIMMYLLILTVSIYLLSRGISDLNFNDNASSMWDYGLGELTTATLITPFKAPPTGPNVILIAFLANVPQLFVSAAYFLYNSLLSCMFLAAEQDKYAIDRKPLRVSHRQGAVQRRSHYLSLPYRYSLPLLAASALLHWLVSESIFFVAVTPFRMNSIPARSQEFIDCGFSLVSLIFAIVLGGLLILVAILLGLRRFKSRMPLMVSCSVAISAACHPRKGEGHALKPVMWGEVVDSSSSLSASSSDEDSGSDNNGDSVGGNADGIHRGGFEESQERLVMREGANGSTGDIHAGPISYAYCSFTSEKVVPPSETRVYM
ncbi:hypothetical protein FQN54_009961 [Arachnomyces sp. PD_36]|nr:hypothetical protein FQN54_009961 [Arachnomyces sp. PD_36]